MTKIVIGVAAGIALFLVGEIVLPAVLLDFSSGNFSVVAPDGQTYDEQTYSDTWAQSFPEASIYEGGARSTSYAAR